MTKVLSFLFLILCFTCCKTHEQEKIQTLEAELDSIKEQKKVPINTENNLLDSGVVILPNLPENTTKLSRRYKSIPDIIKHEFSEGSKKGEVLNIQGKPDFIDEENGQEVWYYGNCKIYFKGDLVDNADSGKECTNFSELGYLLHSGDVIERKFGVLLRDRTYNNN